eukprot:8445362-Pyramimonas_sp.AAC.1
MQELVTTKAVHCNAMPGVPNLASAVEWKLAHILVRTSSMPCSRVGALPQHSAILSNAIRNHFNTPDGMQHTPIPYNSIQP